MLELHLSDISNLTCRQKTWSPLHPNSYSFAMSVINTTICPGAQTQCLGDFLAPLLAAGLIASFCPLLIWFTHTGLFARSVPIRRPLHLLFQLHGASYPKYMHAHSSLSDSSIAITLHHLPSFIFFVALYYLFVCLFIYWLCLSVSSTTLYGPRGQGCFYSLLLNV